MEQPIMMLDPTGVSDAHNTEVRTLLNALGTTPDEVVATLDREQCYGPRNNECDCPVAKYLTKHTGLDSSATAQICVTGQFTLDADGNIDSFIGKEWTRTPEPVAAVIDRFDSGQYSVLEGRVS